MSEAQREGRKKSQRRDDARRDDARRAAYEAAKPELCEIGAHKKARAAERRQRDGKRTIDVMAQRREPGDLTFSDWERWQ
jgi:hypothetical protein